MNRRTLLAIVGGTLAVVLLWWFAILSPKRSATSTARAEADAAVARGQELEQTLARLRELDRNRPQIEADLRALNAAIPATPDLATFILSANEIAASSTHHPCSSAWWATASAQAAATTARPPPRDALPNPEPVPCAKTPPVTAPVTDAARSRLALRPAARPRRAAVPLAGGASAHDRPRRPEIGRAHV